MKIQFIITLLHIIPSLAALPKQFAERPHIHQRVMVTHFFYRLGWSATAARLFSDWNFELRGQPRLFQRC